MMLHKVFTNTNKIITNKTFYIYKCSSYNVEKCHSYQLETASVQASTWNCTVSLSQDKLSYR